MWPADTPLDVVQASACTLYIQACRANITINRPMRYTADDLHKHKLEIFKIGTADGLQKAEEAIAKAHEEPTKQNHIYTDEQYGELLYTIDLRSIDLMKISAEADIVRLRVPSRPYSEQRKKELLDKISDSFDNLEASPF